MKKFNFSLLVFVLISCADPEPVFIKNQNVGGALGTSYSLLYLTGSELDLQLEIDSVFAAVNRSLSTYIPDSDISRINNGDSSLVIDHMFKDVFELSKAVYNRTDGYFDPTVGTLVNAWGFGPGRQIEMDSSKVDSLMRYVGFEKVDLTSENKVHKTVPNVLLDFNAVAKGYAIDRLAVLMDEKGVQDYLLEVGGELVAKGENRLKSKQWVVGIDDPQAEEGRTLKITIKLRNRAMASSGNYRKFRVDSLTGKKYVHTIDPKTGFTKNARTLAANVLAPSCAEADAYATAFMAMDLHTAIALIESQTHLDAYLIYLDEKGKTQEYMTPGFNQLLK